MSRCGFPPSLCRCVGGVPHIRFQGRVNYKVSRGVAHPLDAVPSTYASFLTAVKVVDSQIILCSHFSAKEFLISLPKQNT